MRGSSQERGLLEVAPGLVQGLRLGDPQQQNALQVPEAAHVRGDDHEARAPGQPAC